MAFLRPLSRSAIPALASSSSSLAVSSSSSSSLLASSARASCSTGPTLKRFVRRGLPAFPSTVIPPRVRAPVYDPARVAAEKAGSDVPPPTWSPLSRRCGLLAVKKGMTQVWDANGVSVPVTVLQVDNCQVVSVVPEQPGRTPRAPPFHRIQVGAVNLPRYEINSAIRKKLGLPPTRMKKEYKLSRGEIGHFKKHDIPPKKVLQEFRVSKDALLPIGSEFSACHFVPGQHIDVQSISIGHGFTGVMKRWNFSGGNASHGASLSHRAAGSTGQNQDPGRVFPGKKMAGRHGAFLTTKMNLLVQRIDTSLNLIFVKGNVPGRVGATVRLTDAIKGVRRAGKKATIKGISPPLKDVETLPFPMGDRKLASQIPVVVDAAPRPINVPM